MKNFNLKSILATILLLLGVSQTAWGRTIYLDTSGASSPYDGQNWWAHIWDGDGGGDKALTKVKDNLYKVEVGTCSKIIFVPNNSTGSTWDNQTGDITIPSDKNCYQITSKDAGTWSTYTPLSSGGTIPKQIKGSFDSWKLHDFTESGGLYSYTYTNLSANTSYEFVVVPQNGSDFKNKKITKANPSAVLEQSGSNATIKTDVAGDYKFTWDPATNTITVTYPSSTTVDECKLYYANENSSGSHTGAMESYIVMQYDNVSAAYYADVTTAATYYCYRYQKTGHSSLYAANWNSHPKGTEVVANGAKVDANQDVSGWGDKSVCYYKGTSGDNIRIWIDYDNKKTWITKGVSSTYTVTITAGEGGSVSPSGAQQVGSTPVAITATPNTGYVFDKWTVSGGATVASTTSATTTVTATATGSVTANFKASSTSVSYYYHDDKNTKWTGDGQVGTANSTEGYVYWEFSKNQYDDNNFKIFNCKPKPTDEQEGQIHPNLIGYDDKIDNTLSNGGLTLTDPSGDNWHNIRLPNTSGAYYIILYLPKSTYNTTSEYKVAIRVTLPGTTAATSYWYFDDKNTGWDNTIADTWKFVDAGNYAYVLVPANNESNKFKVFSCNPKNDSQLVANDGNIATGELAGDIALKNTDTEWHNIVIDAVPSDYYVILYYPNTSTNSSNKYLVAATYDLPGVQKYAVSFGVVGKTGGTITAKSGSSTITSGQLVSRATFTATPAAGYSVEGWYADAEGNIRIDAAGTQTTYSQAITEANNTVYVKFAKAYAIYYKFNDQKWNDNYYAYIFTDEVWHSDNGVQPKVNRSEYGQMSKYNDSVYYYKFTKSADYTRFAFSWGDHNNDDYFNNIDAVYRSDFHKDMPVFIAERGQSASVTKGKYYNKGVWMKFNDTDPGYNLCLTTDNGNTWNESYRFTAAKAGDYISTVDVVLTKGITYKFWVKNDKPYYFKTEEGTCTSNNHQFTFYEYDNGGSPITITPAVTGTYTFQLNLANGKVEIDVLYPTTSYRLVYVEKNDGTIEKFHPSHIIKSHPEATEEAPMFDTVSMHVRLKLLQKKALSGTTDVKYDTLDNNNTCEVWLQEFKVDNGAMDWKTIQNINTKTYLTTNGVYNFIITQAAGTATIEPTAIRPYTGRYYIRTDASDGGWKNYKQLSNYCYYTEYSRVYRGFDYYFCRWASKANIKYTIACDYSYCVSDTLAQEDHAPHSIYTDGEGTLQHEANVRFMWHSFSNELDRAYIAGAGDNLYLMSNAGIYDMKGNQNTSAKLEDQQNWVYRVDVKADTRARIKLRAVPYNSATTYSWFRGLDGDFSEANTEQLIEGKFGTQYTIRVIYDFKTDHLICAWIPDKDTITANDVINADLMIIRTDQGEAAQLNFKPNQTQLTNITVAYCVLNLTRDSLKSKYLTPKEKSCYWVSFPFDVNLSDVFGCGKYGEDFIIQYYDGAERAQKGCWIDSPTYWKYITNPTGVVLKKGMGYVLVIDYEKILSEQFKHNNTSVNIYFPSSGPIHSIDGVLPTAVEVPKHECTITRNDRYIYDSNWNIIGVPTWANIDEFGNPMVATQSTSNLSQGGTETYTIGFYYAHDAKNNKWTVCDTKEVDFLSMYSYLVQWSGTINWAEKSASGKHHPTLAPRRYAPAAEGEEEAEGAEAPEQYTLRLTLNRGEQQLDHTYVRLQEGNVTTDFDLNYDMTKILNDGTNLYSLVGTNLIQCAANVQPLQEEAQTISIPLGVVADQDGLYTFSLPDGTEGMNVSIADFETGTVHNLSLGDYQTALTKGTYEQRFALEIQPRQEVSTGCEQTDAAGKSLRKVLIDGNLYILRDGKAYTAAGQEL